MAAAVGRSPEAAAQLGDAGRLSARIDLHAGYRPGGAGERQPQPGGSHLLQWIDRFAGQQEEIRLRLIAATVGSQIPSGADREPALPETQSLFFHLENLKAVQAGMDLVVNSPGGTAFASRIMQRGMAMAGKTGTSQVRRLTEGERERRVSQEQLPWQLRDHALFCAYAPVDNPRYACAVVVEHGMGGSHTAAPIPRDIQETEPSPRIGKPRDGAPNSSTISEDVKRRHSER